MNWMRPLFRDDGTIDWINAGLCFAGTVAVVTAGGFAGYKLREHYNQTAELEGGGVAECQAQLIDARQTYDQCHTDLLRARADLTLATSGGTDAATVGALRVRVSNLETAARDAAGVLGQCQTRATAAEARAATAEANARTAEGKTGTAEGQVAAAEARATGAEARVVQVLSTANANIAQDGVWINGLIARRTEESFVLDTQPYREERDRLTATINLLARARAMAIERVDYRPWMGSEFNRMLPWVETSYGGARGWPDIAILDDIVRDAYNMRTAGSAYIYAMPSNVDADAITLTSQTTSFEGQWVPTVVFGPELPPVYRTPTPGAAQGRFSAEVDRITGTGVRLTPAQKVALWDIWHLTHIIRVISVRVIWLGNLVTSYDTYQAAKRTGDALAQAILRDFDRRSEL